MVTGSNLRYQHISDVILQAIVDKHLAPGQKLPSLVQMSAKYGMNIRTVRRGVQELASKGILEVRHGAGVFVTNKIVQPKASTTQQVSLLFAREMLRTDASHPVIGASLAEMCKCFQLPDYMVSSLTFEVFEMIRDAGQIVVEQGIGGLIGISGQLSIADMNFLATHKIPLVSCMYEVTDHEWPMTVKVDRLHGLELAVKHLRGLGHRRIAFVTLKRTMDEGLVNRCFTKLVYEHRLGDIADLLVELDNISTLEGVHYEGVSRLFAISPMVTAAIVLDEFLADYVLDGCDSRGLRVPDDISIVTLQDAKPTGHRLPLTTIISLDVIKETIQRACGLLETAMSSKGVANKNVVIKPSLVHKASSGPVKKTTDP